jgi:hypothetical protein
MKPLIQTTLLAAFFSLAALALRAADDARRNLFQINGRDGALRRPGRRAQRQAAESNVTKRHGSPHAFRPSFRYGRGHRNAMPGH